MTAYLVALDCFDDARAYAVQALEAARDVRAPVLSAFVLQHFAAIAALQGASGNHRLGRQPEQAPMLLGFVEARLRALGARRDHTERQEHERVAAVLKGAFGQQLDKLMALGAQWSEEAAATAALEL